MTITIADGVITLAVTLLQFAVGISAAMAGYHLLGYVQNVWKKRSAK
jgi:hypothetical protein